MLKDTIKQDEWGKNLGNYIELDPHFSIKPTIYNYNIRIIIEKIDI